MGKEKGKKKGDKETKKKKQKEERKDSVESSSAESPSATPDSSKSGDGIGDVEKFILELREKGKKDPNIDFVKELRKIQDHISDIKGEDRRPVTAVTPNTKKNMKRIEEEKNRNDNSDDSRSSAESDKEDEEDDDEEEEEEEEAEDPDALLKELINKRLTTCMMLALSFESDSDYPRDFYEKLADSNKFKEVTQPFKKEEMQTLNQILKERKNIAKKRLEECGGSA